MVALVETQNTITTPSSESIQGFDKYLRLKSVQEFLQFAEEIRLDDKVANGYWLGIDIACANGSGINFASNTWLAQKMPITSPGGFLLAIDPQLAHINPNASNFNTSSSGSPEQLCRIPNLTPIMVPAPSNDRGIIDLLSNKADQVSIIAPDNSQSMNVIEMIKNAYQMTKPGTGKLTIALDHLNYKRIQYCPEFFTDVLHDSLMETGSLPLLRVNGKKYSESPFWLIPRLTTEEYLSQEFPKSFWFNPEEADKNVLVLEISKQPKHILPIQIKKPDFHS